MGLVDKEYPSHYKGPSVGVALHACMCLPMEHGEGWEAEEEGREVMGAR
jgi:hypothetical protein